MAQLWRIDILVNNLGTFSDLFVTSEIANKSLWDFDSAYELMFDSGKMALKFIGNTDATETNCCYSSAGPRSALFSNAIWQ